MDQKTLSIKGESKESVEPDTARLKITVHSDNVDYDKCVDELSKRSSMIVDRVMEAGFEKSLVRISDYRVGPDLERDDNDLKLNGFKGECELNASLPLDLERVNKLVSAVVYSDTSSEVSLTFSLGNEEKIRDRLLRAAVRNARARAESIVEAAGEKLGPIVRIQYGAESDDFYRSQVQFSRVNTNHAMVIRTQNSIPSIYPKALERSETVLVSWSLA